MTQLLQIATAALACAVIFAEKSSANDHKKGAWIVSLSALILAVSVTEIIRDSKREARVESDRAQVRSLAKIAFEEVLDDYVAVFFEDLNPGFTCTPGDMNCEQRFCEIRSTFEVGGLAVSHRQVRRAERAEAISYLGRIDNQTEYPSTIEVPIASWAERFSRSQVRLEQLLQVYSRFLEPSEFEQAELLRHAQYPKLVQALRGFGVSSQLMMEFSQLGYVDGASAFAKFVSALEGFESVVREMPSGHEDISAGEPYN